MEYGGEGNCPEEFEICLDEESYDELIIMMEEAGVDMTGELDLQPLGDAEAVANFTWEILFLSPWELAHSITHECVGILRTKYLRNV